MAVACRKALQFHQQRLPCELWPGSKWPFHAQMSEINLQSNKVWKFNWDWKNVEFRSKYCNYNVELHIFPYLLWSSLVDQHVLQPVPKYRLVEGKRTKSYRKSSCQNHTNLKHFLILNNRYINLVYIQCTSITARKTLNFIKSVLKGFLGFKDKK